MCGRYNFQFTPAMAALFEQLGVPANPKDRLNIAPTESVPIILERDKQRECHLAHWWLIPEWSAGFDSHYSMFNARAENLERSRAFKGPFHHKRCIMPASSFLEWQATENGKQPWEILRPQQQPIVFAGLWDCWNNEIVSCSLVTTKADKAFDPLKNRMPVMLNDEAIALWLTPDTDLVTLQNLLTDKRPYSLQARAVDKAINSGALKAPTKPTGEIINLVIDE